MRGRLGSERAGRPCSLSHVRSTTRPLSRPGVPASRCGDTLGHTRAPGGRAAGNFLRWESELLTFLCLFSVIRNTCFYLFKNGQGVGFANATLARGVLKRRVRHENLPPPRNRPGSSFLGTRAGLLFVQDAPPPPAPQSTGARGRCRAGRPFSRSGHAGSATGARPVCAPSAGLLVDIQLASRLELPQLCSGNVLVSTVTCLCNCACRTSSMTEGRARRVQTVLQIVKRAGALCRSPCSLGHCCLTLSVVVSSVWKAVCLTPVWRARCPICAQCVLPPCHRSAAARPGAHAP